MLNIAVKAARRAGSVINRATLSGNFEVESKRINDFVTEVDRAAEAEILRVIQTAYPDHAILAEESGELAGSRGASEYLWIIDPLDGTTNFIHGFPQFAVSIALQHKGQLTQAVVFDPTRNELFTASKGAGAYLNDHRLRVSRCTHLRDALIGTGFPFKEMNRLDPYMRQLKTMMGSCAGVRRAGAAALDLAFVAAGRLDGFWELGLAPWDMAAGALLIKEAGGLVGDPTGEDGWMASGDIIGGTPKVFAQLIESLKLRL